MHLLRGMLQHEFLRLGKLRDHAQSRSTLPLSRATPAGFSRSRGSHDDGAHNRAHRLPLGRRRRPKKRKSHQNQVQPPPEKYNPYSPITTPSRSGAPLPSPHRLNGWLIRRPLLDVRRHPTCRKTQTRFKYDQTRIQRQFQIRIQDNRSQMHT